MQHSFFRPLFAALTLALFAVAAPGFAASPVKSVALTAIVEHPALDAARDGVKDELKGGSGSDWFLADTVTAGKDKLADFKTGVDFLTQIT